MGGGYDIGASLSGSSSATSGASFDFRNLFGDTIVGGRKPTPPWLMLVIVGAITAVAIVFVLRKV
jgi:hypothetical protein